MKPALTRCGKRGWRSISGPCVATGAASTSSTHLHRMRVAHRQHGDLDDACVAERRAARARTPSPSARGARPAASNGTRAGSKTGAPMSTVTRPSASRRGSITPSCVSHADRRLVGQALVAHEAHEAARAVAALLDLVAAAALKIR